MSGVPERSLCIWSFSITVKMRTSMRILLWFLFVAYWRTEGHFITNRLCRNAISYVLLLNTISAIRWPWDLNIAFLTMKEIWTLLSFSIVFFLRKNMKHRCIHYIILFRWKWSLYYLCFLVIKTVLMLLVAGLNSKD